MKSLFIGLITVLFCSCNNNKYYGHVYDYDTDLPIKNVHIDINGNKTQTDTSGYFCLKVKSNSKLTVSLKKEGYASKKLNRKPDSLGQFSKTSLDKRIYLLNKESDFSR